MLKILSNKKRGRYKVVSNIHLKVSLWDSHTKNIIKICWCPILWQVCNYLRIYGLGYCHRFTNNSWFHMTQKHQVELIRFQWYSRREKLKSYRLIQLSTPHPSLFSLSKPLNSRRSPFNCKILTLIRWEDMSELQFQIGNQRSSLEHSNFQYCS
jgi:hypothetical protein